MAVTNIAHTLAPTNVALLTLTLLVACYWFIGRPSRTGSSALDNAPKIGISNVWFSSLRAKLHFIKHGFGMIYEAYEKVCISSESIVRSNVSILAPGRYLSSS